MFPKWNSVLVPARQANSQSPATGSRKPELNHLQNTQASNQLGQMIGKSLLLYSSLSLEDALSLIRCSIVPVFSNIGSNYAYWPRVTEVAWIRNGTTGWPFNSSTASLTSGLSFRTCWSAGKDLNFSINDLGGHCKSVMLFS